jgi:hypothetical protein
MKYSHPDCDQTLPLFWSTSCTESGPIAMATLVPNARIQKTSPYFSCITGEESQPSRIISSVLPTTGRPSSPMTGSSPLPAGGSASATGDVPIRPPAADSSRSPGKWSSVGFFMRDPSPGA